MTDDRVAMKSEQAPPNSETVRALESALNDLGRAQAELRGLIDDEHIDAMDRAWEAGEKVLSEMTEAVWPTT